jgi:hypothetical protein
MPIRSARPARPWRIGRASVAAAVVGSALLFCSAPPAFADATADQATLQAQTLALTDLPTGWLATNGSTSGGGGATTGCKGKPFASSQRTAVAAVSYQGPSELPQLFEQIAAYSSASSVFAHGIDALGRCHLVSLNQGGILLKIHVAKLSFPGGKLTRAYSLTFTAKGQKVGIDLVVERLGAEIAEVSVADIPSPKVSQLKTFVTTAVNKIKASPQVTG